MGYPLLARHRHIPVLGRRMLSKDAAGKKERHGFFGPVQQEEEEEELLFSLHHANHAQKFQKESEWQKNPSWGIFWRGRHKEISMRSLALLPKNGQKMSETRAIPRFYFLPCT